jgi:hypothetical protein
MKNIKLFYAVMFLCLLSFSSCVLLPPFFPRRYYCNGLPYSVDYNEHGYEGYYSLKGKGTNKKIVNNELQDYVLNGAYVSTSLDREGFSNFYYLQITFTHLRDISKEFIRKEFTELIIKDLQIKSESGIDYSDKVGLEFPYKVLSAFHKTGAVFDFKNERIEVILTVEVNNEGVLGTKTMVYSFEPKVGGLAPPP